jgi:hypothetical protein
MVVVLEVLEEALNFSFIAYIDEEVLTVVFNAVKV